MSLGNLPIQEINIGILVKGSVGDGSKAYPARRVDCSWYVEGGGCDLIVRIKIVTHDKPGVLASITRQLTNMGRNIIGVEAQTTPERRGVVILKLQVSSVNELKDIQQQLEAIDGVIYLDSLSN